MVSHLEGFLKYNELNTPQRMGYLLPEKNQSLPAYMATVQSEVHLMELNGLVDSALVTSDLRELDKARQSEGVTLCCLIPDSIDDGILDILLQCTISSKADGRYYFTDEFRKGGALMKKSQELIAQQGGTIYQGFPFAHQDFVLLFTHDPRVERLIANKHVMNRHLTRFTLP